MPSRERGRRRLAGTVTTLAAVAAVLSGPGLGPAAGPVAAARADVAPAPAAVSVQVSAAADGGPLPAGFLGFSVEYSALHAYLGRNPHALNPLFVGLLEGVDQGQDPVLRVGGNSSDESWLPLPGLLPAPGVSYGITPDWLATVHALAQDTDARLILGVNLADDDPQAASVMGRALVDGIGRRSIEDLEIGNEPDLYLRNPWYTDPGGVVIHRRAGSYPISAYAEEVAHWTALLPRVPLASGAVATLGWLPRLDTLAARQRRVSMVTAHRYALTNCGVAPDSPSYPTIPNLLSTAATSGLAAPLAAQALALHAEGLNFRIDELNTASCEGTPGVSDTFASALWILDELFDLAQAGVDGVNVHTLPGAAYAPFSFTHAGGQWQATVHPLYDGMLFFARAFPAGADLLTSSDSSTAAGGDVKAFTTETSDGTLRTTLINEDPALPATVTLTLPTTAALSPITLTAPSLEATSGVSIGGASFADPTTTAALAAPTPDPAIAPVNGSYTVTVPAASAVLLTSTG